MATVQEHYNNNVVDITRENKRSRNLKDAQISNQKKQREDAHIQQISQNMRASKQNMSQPKPQTSAQQKQALKKQQKTYLQKVKASKKTKAKKKRLMKIYTKDIKRYENTPWILMYTAVGINILGGLLTEVGIGYLFIIPATIFIDIMVWKAFSKKDRIEINALIIASSIIKFIPIIGILPVSWRLVYVAEKKAKEKMEKSKKKIKKLNML